MRKPLALLAAAGATAALAVPAFAATKTVRVDDDYFVRSGPTPTVTVNKGDTVKWVWRGDVVHNVVVEKGPVKFNSGIREKGDTYKRVMRKRGLYSILCTIHPGMDMKLRVK